MSPICWYLSGACLPSRPVASPAARCRSFACSPLASAAPPTSPVFSAQCPRLQPSHTYMRPQRHRQMKVSMSAHDLSMVSLPQHTVHTLPAHQPCLCPSLTLASRGPQPDHLSRSVSMCALGNCCILLQCTASCKPVPFFATTGHRTKHHLPSETASLPAQLCMGQSAH